MAVPTPPAERRSGLFGWVSRNPRRAFWLTAIVALLVGLVIGAAGASDQSQLDQAKADGARATAQASSVTRERDRLRAELAEAKQRGDAATERAKTAEAAVKTLSAKAEVPDLTGDDADTAAGDEIVQRLGWKVRTVHETTANAAPGTVIAQKPREGSVLKAGRSITLTVARKPPPKPKQWVTIKSLTGAGSTKTEEFRVPSEGKARLLYSMPEGGNNAIELYRAPKEYVDLLLNEIGPQQGSTRLYEAGTFYLDVTGSYSIQVQVFKRPS
jgi:hypothetical protein